MQSLAAGKRLSLFDTTLKFLQTFEKFHEKEPPRNLLAMGHEIDLKCRSEFPLEK
jgi:hypothetical protein